MFANIYVIDSFKKSGLAFKHDNVSYVHLSRSLLLFIQVYVQCIRKSGSDLWR